MAEGQVLIKDLPEATTVADSSYIPVDNGTLTQKISVENFNDSSNQTAKAYAEQAQAAATTATEAIADVNTKVDAAQAQANIATTQAGYAQTYAGNAQTYAGNAQGYANTAQGSATNAAASASAASSSADAANDNATLARSWAEGNTGAREGENTNNARYWANKAESAAQITIDPTLDPSSTNPVENRAIYDAINAMHTGGSNITITTTETSLRGKDCVLTDGTTSYTEAFDLTGKAVFEGVQLTGNLTITSTDGTQTATDSLNVPYFGNFSKSISFWRATIAVTTTTSQFNGLNVVAKKNGAVMGTGTFSSGSASLTVPSAGTYVLEVTLDWKTYTSSPFSVTEETTYNETIDGYIAPISLTTPTSEFYGQSISVTRNGVAVPVSLAFDNTGAASFTALDSGSYVFTLTYGGEPYTATVSVEAETTYSAVIKMWTATINISTTSSVLQLQQIVIKKSGVQVGTTQFSAAGTASYIAHETGTYTFECTYDSYPFSSDPVAVTEETTYSTTITAFTATLNITTTSTELYSQTITIKKGSTTIGTTAFSSSGSATFRVHEIGMYTAECTYGGDTYYSDEVSVSAETTYPMSIDIVTTPDGKTVTPTDDIPIWLACADITDKTYTTLSEVLADRETLYQLMANDNAVDYLVRSTTWAASNGEGKIPTMTGPTTPSGEASGSSSYATDKEPWKAFDGDDSTWWQTSNSAPGTLTYTFSSAVTLRRFSYKAAVYQSSSLRIKDFKILASNDGFVSDSHELYSGTHDKTAFSDPTYGEGILDNDSPYTSYRMQIINTDASNVNPGVATLQYYDTIGIPDSKYAMKYIGKWNYASDTLLSDSIWLDAIYGSEYMEEVLNTKVPTLTGASANAGSSGDQSTNYAAWRAFNGNNSSYGWMPPPAWGHYVYYHFDSPVSIKKASILLYDSTSREIKNIVQVIASNDGTTWNPISAEFTMSGTNVTDNITLNNNSSYSYYGVKVISSTSGHSADKGQGYHIQFYGRQDVTEGLIDIYSAASDTVYYMDNGSPVTVCTTDASGHGTVAKSSLPNGTYTLYSTVNQTSKTVTVTDGTSEIDLT